MRRGMTNIFPREPKSPEMDEMHAAAFRRIGIELDPPGTTPTFRVFLYGLGFLEKSISQLVSDPRDIDTSVAKQISPLDVFLGDHLLEIYERFFGKRATISRNPYVERSKAAGPYIRFARAVMNVLGSSSTNLP